MLVVIYSNKKRIKTAFLDTMDADQILLTGIKRWDPAEEFFHIMDK